MRSLGREYKRQNPVTGDLEGRFVPIPKKGAGIPTQEESPREFFKATGSRSRRCF